MFEINLGNMFGTDKRGRKRSKPKRVLKVFYNNSPSIKKWEVSGRTGGFGRFHRKTDAVSKGRKVLRTNNLYGKLKIYKKNGALQRSIGS